MFDNLRKNSYGNIQVRVYFKDLDIVEHYLTRFERALHKVRIIGDKLKRYIKKNKIKGDIEKVFVVYNYIFKNISYGKIDLFYTRFKHNTLVLQEQQDCLKIDGFDTLRYHGFSGARMVYSGCKDFDNTKFNDIFNSLII